MYRCTRDGSDERRVREPSEVKSGEMPTGSATCTIVGQSDRQYDRGGARITCQLGPSQVPVAALVYLGFISILLSNMLSY